jgi:hypothetical protein
MEGKQEVGFIPQKSSFDSGRNDLNTPFSTIDNIYKNGPLKDSISRGETNYQ